MVKTDDERIELQEWRTITNKITENIIMSPINLSFVFKISGLVL